MYNIFNVKYKTFQKRYLKMIINNINKKKSRCISLEIIRGHENNTQYKFKYYFINNNFKIIFYELLPYIC